ncbi:Zeatin O-glucosyltransferase [Camellia lanceoleosa]|uniref:Zeatin O-glucosyltransferase n=1 Tax=Camellia lanceoleosa TaxID=1840588 RepID=A0ACC0GBI4_9ERIC|nr:Zeatin O-glucosyltransferase [Camellia lanceoleosa]
MTELLHKISSTARKVIVVHDALMAYVVQDIATTPNSESYSFTAISAFACFFEGWQMMGKSSSTRGGGGFINHCKRCQKSNDINRRGGDKEEGGGTGLCHLTGGGVSRMELDSFIAHITR